MLKFDHFGVAFTGRTPVSEIVDYARTADEAGLGSIWMTESMYFRAALSTMMAVAGVTQRIQIGPGVASIFGRHPAIMAMESAAIDEFSNGRFFLGLGATPLEPFEDFKSLRPLRAFREYLEIFNALIAREMIDYEGEIFQLVKAEHFSSTNTSLNFQPLRNRIPIYIGTTGPMTLRLAGKIADGVILTNLSNPEYIRWVARHVEAGERDAGREAGDCKICAFITFAVDEDREAAVEATREILAIYYHNVGEVAASNVGTPDESLSLLGVTAEHYHALDEALQGGGLQAAKSLIGDDEIQRSAVAGTPQDCVEQLIPFLEAGLQVPIAFHAIGPDKKKSLRLIGEQIVPALQLRLKQGNDVEPG